MVSISVDEMKEEGLKEAREGTEFKPDEGFRYNPAERKWTPDLGKYDPELRKQVEEAIYD